MDSSTFNLPESICICKRCGPSNIVTGHIVQFKAVKEGNRGRLVCNTCGNNAWDVPGNKEFVNIAGEMIDQIVEKAQLLKERYKSLGL